jgi:hypothetical protein
MNERIKELEVQCWEARQYGPPWFNSVKFAELIIKECASVINKDCETQFGEGIITNLGGLNQARELIKEHFGVE